MKVFISWSGTRSKAVANALHEWLPLVLQYAKPWVSDKDIGAGDRWAQSIAGELDASNFGIICITPENMQSEWILFEAGALSKSMLDAKVIPLLFGLELSDLSGPLSQFQAQKADISGVTEVVRAINKVADNQANDQIVTRSIPLLWPSLQAELDKIPNIQPSEKHTRPQHEILEELVTGVRGLNTRIRDFDADISEKDRFYKRRKYRFYPRMFEEFMFTSTEIDDGPSVLLMMAGILRDDFPWLSELFAESYREIRNEGPEVAERALNRLRRAVKYLSRGSMIREYMGGSKDAMMMMEELPMILDMSLHQMIARTEQAVSSNESASED